MPGLDGTGPQGRGPMTGGRRRSCNARQPAGRPSRSAGAAAVTPGLSRDSELALLHQQAERLKRDQQEIEARINKLTEGV